MNEVVCIFLYYIWTAGYQSEIHSLSLVRNRNSTVWGVAIRSSLISGTVKDAVKGMWKLSQGACNSSEELCLLLEEEQ